MLNELIAWSLTSCEHTSSYMRHPCKGYGAGCLWLLLQKPTTVTSDMKFTEDMLGATSIYKFLICANMVGVCCVRIQANIVRVNIPLKEINRWTIMTNSDSMISTQVSMVITQLGLVENMLVILVYSCYTYMAWLHG